MPAAVYSKSLLNIPKVLIKSGTSDRILKVVGIVTMLYVPKWNMDCAIESIDRLDFIDVPQ